jgi:hypothetical protein
MSAAIAQRNDEANLASMVAGLTVHDPATLKEYVRRLTPVLEW